MAEVNPLEMLVAPIKDEADWQRVSGELEYARRHGDHTGIMVYMAQFAHSQSWRPAPPLTHPEQTEPARSARTD